MKKAATIPTLLALPLLIFVMFGLSLSGSQVTKLFSRASTNVSLVENVELANVSDLGWTVGWTTKEKVRGVVYVGTSENLGEVAVDDREAAGIATEFQTHLVNVRVAQPGKYFFKIGSGSEISGKSDGSAYIVTIPEKLGSGQNIEPIYGKVIDFAGKPIVGGLVKLTSVGAQPLISLTNNDGSFVLPLSSWRTENFREYFNPSADLMEKIEIVGPGGEKSNVVCGSGLDRPVPDVRLGQDLDCRNPSINSANVPETVVSQTPVLNAAPSLGVKPENKFKSINVTKNVTTQGLPVAAPEAGAPINVNDGQVFDNSLPTFSGETAPGQIIRIEVHSATPMSSTVRASADGSWSWTPPANLEPGEHTVTLTITLANGQTQSVTRTFVVSANTNILPITSSGPNDSISPLITPTTTLTPTYPTPTLEPSPTPIFSPVPVEPSPTPPPPPVTGSIGLTIMIFAFGLILLLGGLFVAL